MIHYVFNLSNNNSLINDVDGLDDVQESLEQLIGYPIRNRPSLDLMPLQTGRSIKSYNIDLDEESAKTMRNHPAI